MIRALTTKLWYARRITWGSYFLLILSVAFGGYASGTPGSLVIISILPLIIFLPGMARENYRSLAMLCFVTLLYFIPIVSNVWEPGRTSIDIISLILIVVLFISAMLFSRWKQYELAGNPPRQQGTPIK